MTAETISFYKNGAAIDSNLTNVDYSSISNKDVLAPYIIVNNGRRGIANFGQDSSFASNKTSQGKQDSNDIGDFYYTPPSGFLALCTKNLPNPAVIPSEHFNTVLYSGTGSNQAVSVGFQPDFTWVKERNSSTDHGLWNSVVGASKYLKSNGADAESSSNSYGMQSFDSTGFTMGTSGNFNGSGDTYASWNWKANGTGVSNTSGSITSTVSANADAGFSIVKYVGNQSAAQTIGHGLSAIPEMIIVKDTTLAKQWAVYHTALGNTHSLKLNDTSASYDNANRWNDTTPTTTLFSVGTSDETNYTGDTHIAYCFHSVDGYSKVGSYTGNGSTSGNFIYTGFRPAFVLIHNAGDGGGWPIADDGRGDFNSAEAGGGHPHLRAHSTGVEGDSGRIDLLSNGFRPTVNYGELNSSPFTYVYIAFAEVPFKFSNAK
jgi:hypothetical protein